MWTRFGATNARSSGLSPGSSLKVSPTCCIPRQIPVSDAPLLILFHAVLTPEVYEFPDGQFAGLQKAPNVAINVPNAIMPIIVVEWVERIPRQTTRRCRRMARRREWRCPGCRHYKLDRQPHNPSYPGCRGALHIRQKWHATAPATRGAGYGLVIIIVF